ncbi:LytTR family transcriptional regulator DNA-binding domain-containing protein [Rufibacter hautae]|uniref:LytTR family transcriptional regulator n=1 Tax=Rufibacter hautae TaxID=2595005 RepID=A0A5B6TJ55_9BACT|nr:LytTR family DNA-binding domain-containing protein [Rufibacter hautae]KAA3440066.1 LytTR family transcriptional regulator [Rufibacter hautae]
MTRKAILEKLPAKDFMQVHRSFIVPLRKVDSVRNKILFIGGADISIGGIYEANFCASFPLETRKYFLLVFLKQALKWPLAD